MKFYTLKTLEGFYWDRHNDKIVKKFNSNCIYSKKQADNYIEILKNVSVLVELHEINISVK